MLKNCIVPRLATALGLTAAFAVVTLLASSPAGRAEAASSEEPT